MLIVFDVWLAAGGTHTRRRKRFVKRIVDLILREPFDHPALPWISLTVSDRDRLEL
jgi:hypothetical protein